VNRRGTGVVIVLGLFALAAPRVGESDHSESRAIGSIRAIVSAESGYAAAHGGRFATLDCLNDPACNLADVAFAPFLSPDLAGTREHEGYRFELSPDGVPGADGRSRSTLTHFAVVARPVNGGTKRSRGFCADDRGVIYVTDPQIAVHAEGGRCLDTRNTLR